MEENFSYEKWLVSSEGFYWANNRATMGRQVTQVNVATKVSELQWHFELRRHPEVHLSILF